jgi:hypothetical protein
MHGVGLVSAFLAAIFVSGCVTAGERRDAIKSDRHERWVAIRPSRSGKGFWHRDTHF